MYYVAASENTISLALIISVLTGLAIAIWMGIYSSKKRSKTALPGKDTEIDKH